MAELTVTVRLPEGLHARPAAEIASICSTYASATVSKFGHSPVNAKSILNLLTLGAKAGETLIFRVDGANSEDALSRIELLVTQP
jgi:phosphotransferase system HPr (HPr) family protein